MGLFDLFRSKRRDKPSTASQWKKPETEWHLIRVQLSPQRGHAAVIGERECSQCGKRLEGAFWGTRNPTKVICECGWFQTHSVTVQDLQALPSGELKKLLDWCV